jgi:hypothetical protein
MYDANKVSWEVKHGKPQDNHSISDLLPIADVVENEPEDRSAAWYHDRAR